MTLQELIMEPWPWYVGGFFVGLTVPLLLLLGNKAFGISRSFRHICAASMPLNISYFKYNWKKQVWNLYFVAGVLLGAFLASRYMHDGSPVRISQETVQDLKGLGIEQYDGMAPADIFSWNTLGTAEGLLFIVVGGFFVGFGTRYANGCTSGHSITGLANLQWPSLVATIAFFIGGLISTHFLMPLIMN